MIIAHRAGTGDFPENTPLALDKAVEAGVDGVWLTVQASSDGAQVLYRPADLAALTDGSGPANSLTAQHLQQLNASWTSPTTSAAIRTGNSRPTSRPWRRPSLRPLRICRSSSTSSRPPRSPGCPLSRRCCGRPGNAALGRVLHRCRHHRRLSSGESAGRGEPRRHPVAAAEHEHGGEQAPDPGKWAGFEMHRDITVTEKFTLGIGVSPVNAELRDPASVECFTAGSDMKAIGFAVNTLDDFQLAAKAGLDAVLVASPLAAQQWHS